MKKIFICFLLLFAILFCSFSYNNTTFVEVSLAPNFDFIEKKTSILLNLFFDTSFGYKSDLGFICGLGIELATFDSSNTKGTNGFFNAGLSLMKRIGQYNNKYGTLAVMISDKILGKNNPMVNKIGIAFLGQIEFEIPYQKRYWTAGGKMTVDFMSISSSTRTKDSGISLQLFVGIGESTNR